MKNKCGKTTVVISPKVEKLIQSLPRYVRKNRLYQYLGLLPHSTSCTFRVKPVSEMSIACKARNQSWEINLKEFLDVVKLT